MEIRNYLTGDLDEILELFYQAVHVINAADYTPDQLNAWADGKPDREVRDACLYYCKAVF